jgi:hypothetical protein
MWINPEVKDLFAFRFEDFRKAVLERMARFCEQIHTGNWRGFSGERITDVVNIGIGGSDLGPRMAVHALAAFEQPDISVHFVSNLDSADLASTLTRLNPRRGQSHSVFVSGARYGGEGAAISTSIALVLETVLLFWLTRRKLAFMCWSGGAAKTCRKRRVKIPPLKQAVPSRATRLRSSRHRSRGWRR